jgi:hypothetical protein
LLKQRADLVVVLGTPLDFRLAFGRFGSARVVHVVDSEEQRAGHVQLLTVAGDLASTLSGLAKSATAGDHADWIAELQAAERAGAAADASLLALDDAPIRPSRIYGELGRRLERDAVVICDGGDFASYAGKFVEVHQPGCWLDTGPYGCLATAPVMRSRHGRCDPRARSCCSSVTVRRGFSLMDVDTMVRHGLPVVMVVGNNGMWGLEKHPMQAVYGWDMACDLQPDAATTTSCVRSAELARPSRIRRRSARPGPGVRVRCAVPGERADGARRRLPSFLQPRLSPAPPAEWSGGLLHEPDHLDQDAGHLAGRHHALSSDAETVNVRRRPSTFSSTASASTVTPTAVGCRWSSCTRIPTVVQPWLSARKRPRTRLLAQCDQPRGGEDQDLAGADGERRVVGGDDHRRRAAHPEFCTTLAGYEYPNDFNHIALPGRPVHARTTRSSSSSP